MENSGNYYLINHLVLFTGLSDRTIRNYIASGILHGEKINGLWHFTPEQVVQLIRHPSVRPSIQAKQNGIIYDFLLTDRKKTTEVCTILDIPESNRKEICEFFCYKISNDNYHNIRFSYDGVGTNARIILCGNASEVLRLINEYYQN